MLSQKNSSTLYRYKYTTWKFQRAALNKCCLHEFFIGGLKCTFVLFYSVVQEIWWPTFECYAMNYLLNLWYWIGNNLDCCCTWVFGFFLKKDLEMVSFVLELVGKKANFRHLLLTCPKETLWKHSSNYKSNSALKMKKIMQ